MEAMFACHTKPYKKREIYVYIHAYAGEHVLVAVS